MRSLIVWFVVASVAMAADGPKRPTDEQRGKELYERHCVACHGAQAAGDGPATTALVASVPNLQGAVKADKATIDIVRFGKGPMPAFEASFDQEDSRRVLQFMAKVHEAPTKPADKPLPAAEPAPAEGDAQQADVDDVPEDAAP